MEACYSKPVVTLLLLAGEMLAGAVADRNEAGARLFRNQNPSEAANCFRRSLQLDPKEPKVAKLLGLSEQLTGNYEKARKSFTLLLARVYFESDRDADAQKALPAQKRVSFF